MRSDFETIVVSRHEDQILLVTLNRPEVSNALNTRMGLDLTELFETLAIDLAGLRIVIITGSGDKAFCAGGDLKERNGMTDKTRSPGAWAHDRRQDDWAITPKIQQATSAPPKIRMTKPVRSDRRRPS